MAARAIVGAGSGSGSGSGVATGLGIVVAVGGGVEMLFEVGLLMGSLMMLDAG